MKGYSTSRSGKRTRMLSGQRKRERKDMRNSRTFGYGLALLTGLAVFVVLIVAFSLFFSIGEINVYGNVLYSNEELIEASGFRIGDNLYLFNKYGKVQNMFEKLPYLKKVQIRRQMPDGISIEVEETEARFAVITEEQVWLVSAEGKLLAEAEGDAGLDKLSKVYGLRTEKVAVGGMLSSSPDPESRIAAFLGLVKALDAAGSLDKLGDVDMTEAYDVQFTYEGRFLVSTGMPENLEEKAVYLDEVIRKLAVTDKGYIELGGEQLRYIPSEEAPGLNTDQKNIEVEAEDVPSTDAEPDSGIVTEPTSEGEEEEGNTSETEGEIPDEETEPEETGED